jgi:hypothetical protein
MGTMLNIIFATIAMVAYYGYFMFSFPGYSPFTKIEKQNNIDDVEFYSTSYYEARDRFKNIVRSIPGMELISKDVSRDPNDKDAYLTMDIAIWHGTNDVLLHFSGVHGTEVY